MKLKAKILTLILVLATLISLVGIFAIPASAATPTTIYLKAGGSGLWDQASAWFMAHIWDANGNSVDVKMTKVDSGIYACAVPAGMTKIKFVRKNPSNTNLDWNDVWNETNDLTIPTDGKNCYTITGWGGSDGKWSSLSYYVKGTFNGWGDSTPLNCDNTALKTTVNLQGGSYTFKIYKNDNSTETWWGKNSTTITDTTSNLTLSTTGGDINLKVTKCGAYTFTFSSGKLTITRADNDSAHTQGTAATCTAQATCSVCGKSYGSALGHSFKTIDAEPSDCLNAGNVAHLQCTTCNKYFATGSATNATNGADNANAFVDAADGHSFKTIDAVPSDCLNAGNVEHLQCTTCSKYFAKDSATNATNGADSADAFVDPADGHTFQTIGAVASDCVNPGNYEHLKCTTCEKYFATGSATNATNGANNADAFIDPEDGHSYDESTWAHDENGHWRVCSNECGIPGSYGDHTPNIDAATENEAKVCTVCEYVIQQALGHTTHNYTVAEHDTTHHWNKCYGCDLTTEKVEHSYSENVTTPATCTSVGSKHLSCACGYEKDVEIPQLEHSYTGAIKSDGNGENATHSFKCVNGCNNYGGAENHTWNGGVVTTPAKCEAEGVMTYTCTMDGCGATYTESIEALTHIDANTDHKCDRNCGKTDMGTHADANDDDDHVCDYGCGVTLENCSDADDDGNHKCDVCQADGITEHEWVDATCTAPKTCSECSATEGKKLGHDIVIDAAVAATCKDGGKTEGSHCTRCNDATVAQTDIPALGHKYENGKVNDCCAKVVYFYNDKNWAKVNCYAWGSTTEAGWPGTEMKLVEGTTNLYYYHVADSYANVIFNNGQGGNNNQTVDITIETGKVWILNGTTDGAGKQKGGWHDIDPATTEPTTYYFSSQGWDSPRYVLYAFNNYTGATGWFDLTTVDGHAYYSATIGVGYTHIIAVALNTADGDPDWNNKDNQTVNIPVSFTEDFIVLGQKSGENYNYNWHTHNYGETVTAPTCTVDGYTTHTCACGDSYVDSPVSATGHSFTEKIEDAAHLAKSINCQNYNTYYYDCENCDANAKKLHFSDLTKTYTSETKVGDHVWSGEWTTEDGYHYHECMAGGCDAIDETTKGACSDITTDSDHKCDICLVDGISSHEYTDWTKVSETQHEGTCNCGDEKLEDHTESTEADCLNAAYCDVCNSDYGSAKGHNWGEVAYSWTNYSTCTATRVCATDANHKETATATITRVTTDAKCTTDGQTVYTATFAEKWAETKTETEVHPQTGHSFGDVVAANPATCLAGGNDAYKQCTVCSYYFGPDAKTDATGNIANTFITSKLGHSYTGAIKDEGNGTHSFKCVNGCEGYGAAVDHTFDKQNAVAGYLASEATCTNKATYYVSCTCGAHGAETFEHGGLNANNHTGAPVDGGEADVHSKWSCCGVAISAEHTLGNWTYVNGDSHKKSCDCGYEIIGTHNKVDLPAVEENCTETGLTAGVKCSDCGHIFVEQQVIPTDAGKHVYGDDNTCDKCEYVAEGTVGDVHYNTLQEAVNAGGEITLNKHVQLSETLVIGKDVKIDTNGYTLYSTAAKVIKITANVEIEISGTISTVVTTTYAMRSVDAAQVILTVEGAQEIVANIKAELVLGASDVIYQGDVKSGYAIYVKADYREMLAQGGYLMTDGPDGTVRVIGKQVYYIGTDGYWYLDGVSTGVVAEGKNGESITIVGEPTSVPGANNSTVYTVNFSDGKSLELTVFHGADGKDGNSIKAIQTENVLDGDKVIGQNVTIHYTGKDSENRESVSFYVPNGKDGQPGSSIAFDHMESTVSGKVVTYKVFFTNGQHINFSVTNGEDGAEGNSIAAIVSIPHKKGGVDGQLITITYTKSKEVTEIFVPNGKDGANGSSITVKETEKTTVDNVDTYVVKFSDNTSITFTVTNGVDGKDGNSIAAIVSTPHNKGGVDGQLITITYTKSAEVTEFFVPNGAKGEDGDSLIITDSKHTTEGKVHTYVISFSDGSELTYTVTDGADGADGNGIKGIHTTETEQNGVKGKLVTVYYTKTDAKGNSEASFFIADGKNGEDGNGIKSVETTTDAKGNTVVTIKFTKADDITITIPKGDEGNSIKGVVSELGEKDGVKGQWITITYTDSAEATKLFVPNGKDGASLTIIKTEKVTAENVDTYTITFSDGTTVSYNVIHGIDGEQGDKGDKGETGADGETPYVGENGNWWVGDYDLGVPAAGEDGEDGNVPYIGENGNWWIGDTDLGVPAQGKDGNDNNKVIVISIAIATLCLICTIVAISTRRGRRPWWILC